MAQQVGDASAVTSGLRGFSTFHHRKEFKHLSNRKKGLKQLGRQLGLVLNLGYLAKAHGRKRQSDGSVGACVCVHMVASGFACENVRMRLRCACLVRVRLSV